MTWLDKGELCHGRKYLDEDVRLWRGFGLSRSQETELRHDGLQPWVNSGSLKEVRWKFASLKSAVDTRQTCNDVIGGGVDGHLPTVLDC